MKKYLIILTVVLLIAGIAGFFYLKRTPEISYKTVKIERGTIVSNVAATGNLSAVTTVQVGTQVSGTIQKLYVDYNSRVKKGQAIAEIDPSLFNASVEQSQGNFLSAEANLLKAKVTWQMPSGPTIATGNCWPTASSPRAIMMWPRPPTSRPRPD